MALREALNQAGAFLKNPVGWMVKEAELQEAQKQQKRLHHTYYRITTLSPTARLALDEAQARGEFHMTDIMLFSNNDDAEISLPNGVHIMFMNGWDRDTETKFDQVVVAMPWRPEFEGKYQKIAPDVYGNLPYVEFTNVLPYPRLTDQLYVNQLYKALETQHVPAISSLHQTASLD